MEEEDDKTQALPPWELDEEYIYLLRERQRFVDEREKLWARIERAKKAGDHINASILGVQVTAANQRCIVNSMAREAVRRKYEKE